VPETTNGSAYALKAARFETGLFVETELLEATMPNSVAAA
jgi:hypothetical protein